MLVCLTPLLPLGAVCSTSITARACRPWDVCVRTATYDRGRRLNRPVCILQAGMVIAQEAGGFVTGSKDAPHDGVVTEAILKGRRYLVIRGVAGTSVRTG